MKIEILYPEICCLYGDKGNTQFLKKCLPEAEFIETGLNDEPAFLSGDVALVYMCSMSEKSQEIVIQRLSKWRETVGEMMKSGNTLFLFVGNALEILGKYIKREDGSKIDALKFYDSYTVRQTPKRFNTLIKSKFENMILLGYTSRFAHTYDIPEEVCFAKVIVGSGMNDKSDIEGICDRNLIATYMLGPVLVTNPEFTHYILGRIGADMEKLPFEDDMKKAYDLRLKEFDKPDLELD